MGKRGGDTGRERGDGRVPVGKQASKQASEVIRSPTAAPLLRIYRSFAGLCSQVVCDCDAETRVNLSRAFAPCERLLLIAFFSRSPALPLAPYHVSPHLRIYLLFFVPCFLGVAFYSFIMSISHHSHLSRSRFAAGLPSANP